MDEGRRLLGSSLSARLAADPQSCSPAVELRAQDRARLSSRLDEDDQAEDEPRPVSGSVGFIEVRPPSLLLLAGSGARPKSDHVWTDSTSPPSAHPHHPNASVRAQRE